MLSCPFRIVSVWLDEPTPDCAAFSHGLEWASGLGLPLRLVLPVTPDREAPAAQAFGKAEGEPNGVQNKETVLEPLRLACLARGVSRDGGIHSWRTEAAVQQFLRTGDLCVFPNAMPDAIKEAVLWRSARDPSVSLLICPRPWQPMRKLLVVQEPRNSGGRFLNVVVQVCNAFRLAPTVLTVACDEEQARYLQQSAAKDLTALESPADFDFLVGADTLTAVAVAARCRRCTHVMLERPGAAARFSWFRTDTLSRLLDLPDTLTFLAVPSVMEPTLAQTHEVSSRSKEATGFASRLEP
jgi:hypothetical protein